MSDTRIKFSGEVDYSKRSAAYGSYKYLRVVPIGQGQAPSIQTGSTGHDTIRTAQQRDELK